MAEEKQLLTIREQEFFLFWRKFRKPKPSQSEMARMLGLHRQRVSHLMERLRRKGYIERNGKGGK